MEINLHELMTIQSALINLKTYLSHERRMDTGILFYRKEYQRVLF